METFEAFVSRKSTRQYANRTVKRDDVVKIIEAGCTAPVAGGDWHTLEIIAVEDATMRQRISRAGASVFKKKDIDPLYAAPVIILITAQSESKYPYNASPANAACVGATMCLAATDLGLASTYLTGFMRGANMDKQLIKDLGVADGFEIMAGIIVGYPAEVDDSKKTLEYKCSVRFISE